MIGYDAVKGVGTFGRGPMPGTQRLHDYLTHEYRTGSYGIYNPASVAGKPPRPSLHAEGRAMDLALDANSPERARGDALFDWVMRHSAEIGAQEMLWRGYVWSFRNRHLGKRGPGVQQAAHMNHVHLGQDVHAALHWNPTWLNLPPDPVPSPEPVEDDVPHLLTVTPDPNPYQNATGATLGDYPGGVIAVDGGGRYGMHLLANPQQIAAYVLATDARVNVPKLNRSEFHWRYGIKVDEIDYRPKL